MKHMNGGRLHSLAVQGNEHIERKVEGLKKELGKQKTDKGKEQAPGSRRVLIRVRKNTHEEEEWPFSRRSRDF